MEGSEPIAIPSSDVESYPISDVNVLKVSFRSPLTYIFVPIPVMYVTAT